MSPRNSPWPSLATNPVPMFPQRKFEVATYIIHETSNRPGQQWNLQFQQKVAWSLQSISPAGGSWILIAPLTKLVKWSLIDKLQVIWNPGTPEMLTQLKTFESSSQTFSWEVWLNRTFKKSHMLAWDHPFPGWLHAGYLSFTVSKWEDCAIRSSIASPNLSYHWCEGSDGHRLTRLPYSAKALQSPKGLIKWRSL